jgi:hypothetical protein
MKKKTQELRKAEAKVTELINKRKETELLLREKSKKYRELKRGLRAVAEEAEELRAVAEEAEEVIDRKDRKIRKLTATIHNQTQTISRQRQTIGKQETMIQRLQKKNQHQQQQRPQPDQVPPSPSRPVTRPKSTNSKNPPVPKASLDQEATVKDITDDETSTDEMPIPQPKTYAAKLEEQWLEKYNQLKNYKTKFGDCNVPQHYEHNRQLGTWVVNQRQRKEKLSKERILLLEELCFEWEIRTKSNEELWLERYNELIKFKEQHNHCNVPRNYKHNKPLSIWVDSQRRDYRRGKLLKKHEDMLNEIGFEWEVKTKSNDELWNVRYEELVEFKRQKGHCNVPRKFQHNEQLGRWVSTQRQFYNQEKLSEARVTKLEEIGFEWVCSGNGRRNI